MPVNLVLKKSKKDDSPTPKYNKGRETYLLTIDWLELMLQGKIIPIETEINNSKINNSFTINKDLTLTQTNEFSHPGYKFCFHVIFESEHFANLYYTPTGKHKFKYKDAVQLKVCNEMFYQSGYSQKLHKIIKDLGLDFTHYYRVDIAMDGHGILASANKFLKHRDWKQARKVTIKTEFNTQSKAFDHIFFGSRSSHKYITLYNKSQEIANGKGYISAYWLLNNFSHGKIIDRIELRLFTQALRNFTHDFTELENANYLASYFQSSAQNHLEFYHKNNPKKRRSIVDWSAFKKIAIAKPDKIIPQSNVKGVKTALKTLTLEYCGTTHSNLAEMIVSIAKQYGLLNWIIDNIEHRWKSQIRLKALNLKKLLAEKNKQSPP